MASWSLAMLSVVPAPPWGETAREQALLRCACQKREVIRGSGRRRSVGAACGVKMPWIASCQMTTLRWRTRRLSGGSRSWEQAKFVVRQKRRRYRHNKVGFVHLRLVRSSCATASVLDENLLAPPHLRSSCSPLQLLTFPLFQVSTLFHWRMHYPGCAQKAAAYISFILHSVDNCDATDIDCGVEEWATAGKG